MSEESWDSFSNIKMDENAVASDIFQERTTILNHLFRDNMYLLDLMHGGEIYFISYFLRINLCLHFSLFYDYI